jgi:DNA helicase-2/ATP-dependent DNA helicase PcrA
MSLLDGLTPAQQKAVETISDNLEIIACAGAGKTGVVTRRIINILQKTDIQPENIIAFTFTQKAAVELKDRIYRYALSELGTAKGLCPM